MNCKIFRIQLDNLEWPHGEFSLPPDMQAHADLCAACREYLQMQRQMLSALETEAEPALPADFTAKVLGRLEPAVLPGHAQATFRWKRVAVYAGYAFSLTLALWLSYKNIDFAAINRLLHSSLAQQIQQWLAATGALEILQAFQNFLTSALSFIPISLGLFEKALGKEVLPRAFNLGMVLILTFTVAKASVFLEGWVRQISRRSS